MSEKIENNVDLTHIVSFVVLLLSIAFFLYFVFYRNADGNITHFNALIQDVESQISEIKTLKPLPKQALKTDTPVTQPFRGDSSTFLEKIHIVFIESGLELDHIEKLETDNYTYRFVAFAPFERLLDFLFRIEQSNLAIQDLDVHPYATDKNLVSMTLRFIRHEMVPDEKKAFQEFQEKFPKLIRDPFKKNALIRPSVKPTMINLTWKYNLTGIGFDKARYATIDHKNYYKGDIFNGMRITRIQSDRVYLVSDSQKYLLSFRYRRH